MERYSRDTIVVTTAEINELAANKALDPTVEYWVDRAKFANALNKETISYQGSVEGGGNPVAITGGNKVGDLLTAVPAAGWQFSTGQWYLDGAAVGSSTAGLTLTQLSAAIGKAYGFQPTGVPFRATAALTVAASGAALTISGTPPTTATVGTPYSFAPTAAGGTGTKTFSLTGGAVPAGLTFSTSSGSITGTPTTAATSTGIGIRVTDSLGATADLAPFSITVSAAAGAAVTIPGQSFSTVSGTPTTATVAGDPVLQLADGATTEIANTFTAPAVGGFECFLYLSGTVATPGNVAMAFDIQNTTSGGSPADGANKSFVVNIAAANTVARYQIPAGAYRPDNTSTDFKLRLQRIGANGLDTYTGVLSLHRVEFLATADSADASVSAASAITPTVNATPYNGVAVLRGFAIYTPLWTSPDAIYIAEPVTIGGVQQSRVAKLDKTTFAAIQDVQMGAITHDAIVGHRDASVCVDSANTVIAHREAHHQPWAGRRYAAADMSLVVGVTTPTGLDINCSYRRFYRNPFDGSIWMGLRGNSYQGGVYKWNASTLAFDVKPQFSIAGSNSQLVGAYGLELAFGSANDVYCALEPIRVTSGGASGYPRQNINVIKSADGGSTWSTMSGKPMNTGAGPAAYPGNDDDIAFPSYNNGHNTVSARIAVGTDLQPIIVATWQHPAETRRSLWYAKYDNTAKKWVRRKLLASDGVNHVGNPHVTYTAAGKVIISAATTDDHDVAGVEAVPANNQIYLFVTTDSGGTWRKYAINHTAGGYGGAYLDPESIRIDNVLRMTPRRESDPTASEIWTLAVPA